MWFVWRLSLWLRRSPTLLLALRVPNMCQSPPVRTCSAPGAHSVPLDFQPRRFCSRLRVLRVKFNITRPGTLRAGDAVPPVEMLLTERATATSEPAASETRVESKAAAAVAAASASSSSAAAEKEEAKPSLAAGLRLTGKRASLADYCRGGEEVGRSPGRYLRRAYAYVACSCQIRRSCWWPGRTPDPRSAWYRAVAARLIRIGVAFDVVALVVPLCALGFFFFRSSRRWKRWRRRASSRATCALFSSTSRLGGGASFDH